MSLAQSLLLDESAGLVRWTHPEHPLIAGVATNASLSSGGGGGGGADLPDCLRKYCNLTCTASVNATARTRSTTLLIWTDGMVQMAHTNCTLLGIELSTCHIVLYTLYCTLVFYIQ